MNEISEKITINSKILGCVLLRYFLSSYLQIYVLTEIMKFSNKTPRSVQIFEELYFYVVYLFYQDC